MKRIFMTFFLLIVILTGCQRSDLADYNKAVDKTMAVETGAMNLEMSLALEFDTTDLSVEERRELSYFEDIVFDVSAVYDNRNGTANMVQNSYYNLGGMGYDMTFYMKDGEMVMLIPLLDQYVRFEEADSMSNGNAVFQDVIDSWQSILMEEDVFSGEKAYVTTDRGQLKTTTYHMHIDDEQFEQMKSILIEALQDQSFVEFINSQSMGAEQNKVSNDVFASNAKNLVKNLALTNFEGAAYVDFDGRLIKQTFDLVLINPSTISGELAQMNVNFSMTYDHLGEEVELSIPDFETLEYADPSEYGSNGFFPSELFEE